MNRNQAVYPARGMPFPGGDKFQGAGVRNTFPIHRVGHNHGGVMDVWVHLGHGVNRPVPVAPSATR